MSNLGPQQQNQSFDGLLQIPGGVTTQLQPVQDGLGQTTGLWVSSDEMYASGFYLLDTNTNTVKKVVVGSANSAGTGYRVLRVEN